MRKSKWIVLLVGLLAFGLIAAGCGDDDGDDTSSTPTEATTSEDTTSEDTTSEDTTSEDTTSEDTTSEDTSGDNSPEDVYNACIDVIESTAVEDAAQSTCDQIRTIFEECEQTAPDSDLCSNAADRAIRQLETASGG